MYSIQEYTLGRILHTAAVWSLVLQASHCTSGRNVGPFRAPYPLEDPSVPGAKRVRAGGRDVGVLLCIPYAGRDVSRGASG